MDDFLLAIDVGGSNTRAYLVDRTGRCLGQGRGRGGNPASNSPEQAAEAIILAVEGALRDAGLSSARMIVALLALAGPEKHVARARLESAFRHLGLVGPVVFNGDLSAMFSTMGIAQDGYCIVAGTGAGAVRFRNGEVERVVDADGWLVGDAGSGYWLGLQAARAAVGELDGIGPETALTGAVLDALDIPHDREPTAYGRPASLQRLSDAIYSMRPIELAKFAPLVMAHRDDPVAARLIAEAEGYLVRDFRTAYDPTMPGPVALGGSVIRHLTGLPAAVSEIIRAAGHEPEIHLVADGSTGSIVLAMRAVGLTVDQQVFETIKSSLAERAAAATVTA